MEQNLSTDEKDAEIPEQVEVTAEAGKEEAEKTAAANNEDAPPATVALSYSRASSEKKESGLPSSSQPATVLHTANV